jgi:hypothetical protein
VWPLVGTGADDHVVGVDRTVARVEPEWPWAARPDRVNAHAFTDLTRVMRGVGHEVGDDLIPTDVALRIVAGDGLPGRSSVQFGVTRVKLSQR